PAPHHRYGHYPAGRQWARPHAVVPRLSALHTPTAASLTSPCLASRRALFIPHIDPHMNYILDAATGPLHRCTPTRHLDPGTLSRSGRASCRERGSTPAATAAYENGEQQQQTAPHKYTHADTAAGRLLAELELL